MELMKEMQRIQKVAVLGAGSWGTALASLLSEAPVNPEWNSHRWKTVLWSRREGVADEILQKRTNTQYLPGAVLPEGLQATGDLREAVGDADVVLFAVPASAVRSVAEQVLPWFRSGSYVVHAAKGFEPKTCKRMSEVLQETFAFHDCQPIASIAGPSHAEEVVRRLPAATVAASRSLICSQIVQALFSRSHFRVYTSTDLVGVEIAGALKNIIALASGMAEGLKLGDNAKAALLTRGLSEIVRFGQLHGACLDTFLGLAGVGDLTVTCNSQHSRNLRAGKLFSQGLQLEEVLQRLGMAVEGIETTRSVYEQSKRLRIAMPITSALYGVLFSRKQPQQAVQQLMLRESGAEYSFGSVKHFC